MGELLNLLRRAIARQSLQSFDNLSMQHWHTPSRVLEPTFLKQCPDYARALRETELADYVREARSQARRFLVIWHEHGTRIRSTPV